MHMADAVCWQRVYYFIFDWVFILTELCFFGEHNIARWNGFSCCDPTFILSFALQFLMFYRALAENLFIKTCNCIRCMMMMLTIGTRAEWIYFVPKSNPNSHCVHFSHFIVGWASECEWVSECVIKICLVLWIFGEAKEIHAFHTNSTRSKLENNGKSFFSGAHILQRRWVMLP